MREYKTVLNNTNDEIIIEKSRFIGYSFHISSQDEAENFIKSIKKQHYDATHNCYAYILNDDMSIMKCSDDKEPSSTAGVPMLEVLKKQNITNCLIIATRYFGGIKLGAGGLTRAYSKTAKIALSSNTIVEKRIFKQLEISIDYNFIGKIQKFIENNHILSKAPEFFESVKFILYEKHENLGDLKQDLLNITNGNIIIEEKDEVYIDFIDEVAKIWTTDFNFQKNTLS